MLFWLDRTPFEIQVRSLQYDQQAYRIGRQDLRGVQSEQLIQRVNLHLALGGSFAEPVAVAATTPK